VNKIDTSELFSMKRDQALCHVTVGDDSVDAILTMKPLFINADPSRATKTLAHV
jgi:hypothetical protein